MLVLTRKPGQVVVLNGGQIKVTVTEISSGQVKLGFDAPPEVKIHRAEIQERIDSAAATGVDSSHA